MVFDPIDGSANIDTALTTGSVFGIYGPDEQCLFNIDDDSTVSHLVSHFINFSSLHIVHLLHDSLTKQDKGASSTLASQAETCSLLAIASIQARSSSQYL